MVTMSEVTVSAQAATHTAVRSGLGDLTVAARGGAVTGLCFPHHGHLPDRASFGQYRATGAGDVLDDVRRLGSSSMDRA